MPLQYNWGQTPFVLSDTIVSSEDQSESGFSGVAAGKLNGAVVIAHNLARDAKPDAAALSLGGKEGNKYLLLALRRDRLTVI